MPTISTAFGDLFCAAHFNGDQLPIMLIHGAGSSHLAWPAALRQLPNRPVFIPDLPQHGRSLGAAQQRIGPYAQAMLSLLDTLQLSQVIIAGHSMGGAIAQHMALTAPDRCAALILLSTAARLQVNAQLLQAAQTDLPQAAKLLNNWAWGRHAPEALKAADLAYLQTLDPALLYGDYLACHTFDVSDRLAELTMPILIVCGAEDKMIPPAISQGMADSLTNATIEIIPETGHWAMLEQPQMTRTVIQNWLEQQGL